MPTRHLDTLFAAWERELQLLIDAAPTHGEFWNYWREREEAVERVASQGDPRDVDAAFERLLAIAERGGYVRLPAALNAMPENAQRKTLD